MGASIAAHGRAGRDGERIETRSGTPMAKVSVAVDVERERDGEDRAPAMWLGVIGFHRNADAVAAVRKGDPVHVIGKLQRRRWTDREGQEREAWECIADAIQSHRLPQRQHNGQRQAEPEREATPPASDAPPPSDADVDDQPDFVDDIPF